jgi:signal transduction histidine kinase
MGGTLRTRTTLLVVAVTGLTLTAGAVLLVLILQARLTASNDQVDRARLHELTDQVAAGTLPTTLTDVGDDGVAQAVDGSGRVVARSANIPGAGPLAAVDPAAEDVRLELEAPDDAETERYRVWTARAEGPDGPVTVFVGTSEEAVHEASRTLTRALLVGVPATTLLLGLATWLLLGRALHQVDAIRTEVDSITDAELHRRVPATRTDDEVGRLAATMNRMLARLEASSTRQRTFVADASHDLQSPLAAQRARLEVALSDPVDTEVEGLARDLLAGNAEMEGLVHDLLFLATDDAGAPPPALVPLDLDDLVLEEVARLRPTTGVLLDTAAVSAAPVRGDRAELRRLVRNLLDNAVRHAVSVVHVAVAVHDGAVRLDVHDDGPGVSVEDAERVFERFHRGDAARSRDDGGSGLGLAIARTVARRHGGEVSVGPGPGGHFVLALPAA